MSAADPPGDEPEREHQPPDQGPYFERAGEAPPAEPRSPARRLLSALASPSRSQLAVGVILAVLGFAMVTQVHSNEADDTYAGLRSADLVQVLNGLTAESRRADAEIANLEETRSKLTDSTQRRTAALQRAREQATTLGILAGTLPAVGPGIRVVVTDPEDKVTLNNLLDGIEELRSSGAEAMEFNDSVRVVAQTSFEDADHGVLIDGKRVSAPYTIDVIGDPDTLAAALDFAGGFTFDIKGSGGTVKVQKLKSVKVSTVVHPGSPRYASPVTPQ